MDMVGIGAGILDFSHGGDQITNTPFNYGSLYIEGFSGYSSEVSGATYSWMKTWTFGGNL
ncbi:hypothetical protein JMN32_14265 [Fulvivirga sp. 29W222]|uniref:Uncharacterized protein n=1 Tax=Fulvivirga marina TaxID=2494733 RepID=A0A937FWS1_9BACT|nr:hypothetical protein [Fulvivirga marina]MBL6447479.1 hypothetical protein [Fulvivirga marina]